MGENFKSTLEQLGLKNEDELKEKMKQKLHLRKQSKQQLQKRCER